MSKASFSFFFSYSDRKTFDFERFILKKINNALYLCACIDHRYHVQNYTLSLCHYAGNRLRKSCDAREEVAHSGGGGVSTPHRDGVIQQQSASQFVSTCSSTLVYSPVGFCMMHAANGNEASPFLSLSFSRFSSISFFPIFHSLSFSHSDTSVFVILFVFPFHPRPTNGRRHPGRGTERGFVN